MTNAIYPFNLPDSGLPKYFEAPWTSDSPILALDVEFGVRRGPVGPDGFEIQLECVVAVALATYCKETETAFPLFYSIAFDDHIVNGKSEYSGVTLDDIFRYGNQLGTINSKWLKYAKREDGKKATVFVCGPEKDGVAKDIMMMMLTPEQEDMFEVINLATEHAKTGQTPSLADLTAYYSMKRFPNNPLRIQHYAGRTVHSVVQDAMATAFVAHEIKLLDFDYSDFPSYWQIVENPLHDQQLKNRAKNQSYRYTITHRMP